MTNAETENTILKSKANLEVQTKNVSAVIEARGGSLISNDIQSVMNGLKKFYESLEDQSTRSPDEPVDDLYENLEKLLAKLENIEDAMKGAFQMPLVEIEGPGGSLMSRIGASFGKHQTNSSTLSADRAKAWITKLEILRAQSQDIQKQQDFARQRQIETNRELRGTLLELENFKAENKTQAEILEVLKKGIDQFTQLKNHWKNLLLFFTDMSNCIKISMGKPLKSFVKHAKVTGQDVIGGKSVSKLDIDQIYGPCHSAVKVC